MTRYFKYKNLAAMVVPARLLIALLAEKRCGVWYLSSARVRNALMRTIQLEDLKNARSLII